MRLYVLWHYLYCSSMIGYHGSESESEFGRDFTVTLDVSILYHVMDSLETIALSSWCCLVLYCAVAVVFGWFGQSVVVCLWQPKS